MTWLILAGAIGFATFASVDDVIFNTIGAAVAGFACYRAVERRSGAAAALTTIRSARHIRAITEH